MERRAERWERGRGRVGEWGVGNGNGSEDVVSVDEGAQRRRMRS